MQSPAKLRETARTPDLPLQVQFLLLVALTGAGMGLVAVAFQELLRAANQLFFGPFHQLNLTANLLDRPYVALIPAAGGLLVGLYFRYVVRRPAGHGVSEVMVSLETRGSRLPWITGIHTAIASSITIGSGGSAGPEGPIIQIGAALSSGLGQVLRLSSGRLRTLVAAGAGAGLAGMYHAPLTGAAFAAEILLEELEPRSFSLLALAGVAATAVAQQFNVQKPVQVPALPPAPWQDIPVDVGIGLLAAPLGVALLVFVHGLGRRTEHSRLPLWLLPAIGGLAVGILGLFLPRILGSGEEGIQQALAGQLAVGLLLVLPLAKLCATSITLGSGATGGVFTPSLFIGATLGGAYGAIVAHAWPGASPLSAYVLVGMGTVVAAAVNAPLTAVLLVCEFTHNFTLLPQIVAAVAASVVLARRLHPESIYTLPLRSLGIDRALFRRTVLANIRVQDVMTATWPVIGPEQSLRQAIALARTSSRSAFPIVAEDQRYAGLVNLDAVTMLLERVEVNGDAPLMDRPVRELALSDVPLAYPDENLHEVALALGATSMLLPIIPVVARDGSRYIAVLERTAILRGYSAAALLQQRAGRQRPAHRWALPWSGKRDTVGTSPDG